MGDSDREIDNDTEAIIKLIATNVTSTIESLLRDDGNSLGKLLKQVSRHEKSLTEHDTRITALEKENLDLKEKLSAVNKQVRHLSATLQDLDQLKTGVNSNSKL